MNKFEKKRLTKQSDYQVQSGAKITCAKFGAANYQLLASGDDQKNISLWKLNKSLPKLVLSGHQTPVSELIFSSNAEQIFSGTFGGTVHMWDLDTKKEVAKFQGHLTKCTCLHSDTMGGNVLVTGSEDTKAKVWDLRSQKCIQTFREHSGCINTIQLSPDARWAATGGDDGALKIWDISSGKILTNFQFPNQAVTCIQFNPQNLALANGSTDKTVKYWDLEQFTNINMTPIDSSAITNLTFDEEKNAEYLFAASSENIKLWNIETNKLLDCLSIIPKTISDLKIANEERFLLMSAISNNTISVWYAPLESINFDESIDIIPSSDSAKSIQEQFMMPSQQQNQQMQMQQQQQQQQKPNFNKIQQTSEELENQRQKQMKENPFQPSTAPFIDNQKPSQKLQQNQQPSLGGLQKIVQSSFANVQPQNQMNQDTEMTDLSRATYVRAPNDKPLGLELKAFEQDGGQVQKKDLEIINEIMDQHSTLVGVIQRRMSSIKVILNWWNKGNVTSALNALSMMNDTSIVMDVLNNTFAENQKVESLNYENIAQIIPHSTTLVNSKYETHILAGLKTTLNILKVWGPEMIKIKTIAVGGGVDLAREERIKKVDTCIDHFQNFYKSKGFQKSLKRQGEVSEVAMLLHNHITNLLNKTRRELEAE